MNCSCHAWHVLQTCSTLCRFCCVYQRRNWVCRSILLTLWSRQVWSQHNSLDWFMLFYVKNQSLTTYVGWIFRTKKKHAIMIDYPSIHEWYFRSVCLNMMDSSIWRPAFRGNLWPYLHILRPWKANIWKGGRCADLPCKRWDDWMIAIGLVVGLTLTKISSEYPQKSRVRPFVGNSRFDIRWFYINLMDALLQLSHLFFVVCIIPWNRLKSHVLLLKVTLYCFTVGEQNAPARLIRPRFRTFVGIPGPMIWTASGMNSRVTPFTVMWF